MKTKFDDFLDEGKYEEAITVQTRKVKWLYENSNKLLEVISEKEVRLIVSRMREKIKELETQINNHIILD